MGKVEKHPPSRSSPKGVSNKSAVSSEIVKQINESSLKRNVNGSNQKQLEDTINDTTDMNDIADSWKTVHSARSNKIQRTNQNVQSSSMTFFGLPVPQNPSAGQVHSYFSSDDNAVRAKPNFNRPVFDRTPPSHQSSNKADSMKPVESTRRPVKLPPFKLEFENQQRPAEILVLNDLVKHNNHLNVNTARYLTHHQSRHLLLLFANDSSTYELLLQPNSWPTRICGLSFTLTSPHRIPTSYSVLVNRVPRQWNVDAMQPLIAQRYPSVLHVARIFHDRQPINRIRVDFQSNDDVQLILQCQHILIDSIRYPALPYKPLTRIDGCYRCQQFGHKAANCTHDSKCFKCGEAHEYNRNSTKPIKCANCSQSHMAGSPECPVEISFRREQRQQTENTIHHWRPPVPPFLSSPSRLYSSVLQSATSQVSPTKPHHESAARSSTITDRSTFIVDTIKDEIMRSQEILLNRMVQLSEKYDSIHEQQRTLNWTLETQLAPFMSTMSEVLMDVCDQLKKTKNLTLNDQQHTKLQRLRSPPLVSPLFSSYQSPHSIQVAYVPLKPIPQSVTPHMCKSIFSPSSFNSFSSQ